MRPRLRLWAGVVISLLFLSLAVRGLPFEDFLGYLRGANYAWLIPAVGIYGLAVVTRTWRWQTMLRHIQFVPLRKLFPIVCIGYMGNNIYPARAGEFLRSYVLKADTGIRMSASLATVVVERLFDGLTMLLFIFVALPFVRFEGDLLEDPLYRNLVVFATILFLAALGTALFFAGRPHLVRGLYQRVVGILVPGAHRESVLEGLDRFVHGFESLAHGDAGGDGPESVGYLRGGDRGLPLARNALCPRRDQQSGLSDLPSRCQRRSGDPPQQGRSP